MSTSVYHLVFFYVNAVLLSLLENINGLRLSNVPNISKYLLVGMFMNI